MGAMPTTVARVLDRALDADPDREALVTRRARLTYGDLDRAANRAAHALHEMGVRPGDRVAASLPNEADVVVAFHGAMRLGAVWVGVNRALAPPEQHHLLTDSGATIMLREDGSADGLDRGGARLVALNDWRAAVDAAADRTWSGPDPDPFAPAGIAYTSGTTGHPKGAVHSQHNLLVPGAVLVETRGYGPELRKGDCFPFTVLNMAVLTTLLVSQAGGTSIVMDRIDAEGVTEWIRAESVTTWNGPPALLHSLASAASIAASDLASLDEVWTGGADCPEAIRAAFAEKFGVPVLATYGLTEAPTVVAIDRRPAGRGGDPEHRPGASGRPLPHLRVRIADADGSTVATGETGQVCISAADDRYRPMLGYWNRPDATAAALVDGELRTGDVGLLDEDGYLHLRDRLSLVIIRGGANVYPAEVERVFAEFPGVAASAVVGVPDERLGERVVALVQPEPDVTLDLEALRAHLGAHLAKYKVPERLTVVDALPRNSMGKIVRAGLADRFTVT
jgi:acyl-CoA synthetase (AMP-forming)/AMP-acid ligase II